MLGTKNPIKNEKEEQNKPAFTADVRCDQCGAQAYVRAYAVDNSAELYFCIHHTKQHEASLVSKGFAIDDRSWALGK